jgi:DnaK suppressor protein
MEREELHQLHTMLSQKKQKVEAAIRQSRSELANMPCNLADPADQATLTTDRQIVLLGHQRLFNQLYEVEQALDLLAKGEYGLCENCGEEIGLARLLAQPSARLCIHCQQRFERAA